MGRLLIVSQVYPPESAAVGQYLADFAEYLVDRGRPVSVLTSAAGYTDPLERYPPREKVRGVEVVRLPAGSFGKASMGRRLLGAGSFLAQSIARGVQFNDVDHVLVSTSPPMAAVAGLSIARWLRVPFTYWVMDINPDQAVAMGHFAASHPAVRVFDGFNTWVLRQASAVITLDEFMVARLRKKVERRIEVLPPWPLDGHVHSVPHAQNPFRRRMGWENQTVVMFSGNMSATSPIDTLVDAAWKLRGRADIQFALIGGGEGQRSIERRLAREPLPNVTCLPYQPLEQLKYSLSAADLHVVTMGETMVGITHPCKIYTAMAVARPVLAIAPLKSHVGQWAGKGGGFRVDQGDVPATVRAIEEFVAMSSADRKAMGRRNQRLVRGSLVADELRSQMNYFCGFETE